MQDQTSQTDQTDPTAEKATPVEAPLWVPSPEELARHEKRVASREEAGSVALPGPLLQAWGDGRRPFRYVTGAGVRKEIVLRPMVAADVVFLQEIESPLLKVVAVLGRTAGMTDAEREKAVLECYKPREGETEGQAQARLDIETVESFFIFTRPVKEVRGLLASGRQVFREAAAELLDDLSVKSLVTLREVLGLHYAAAFATAVEYEAPPAKDDGSFRSAPPGTTGSAGGSTTSGQ